MSESFRLRTTVENSNHSRPTCTRFLCERNLSHRSRCFVPLVVGTSMGAAGTNAFVNLFLCLVSQ